MNWTKNTWGRNIVIVYALFACATLGFVAFAMTQRVDLVSEHYYEDALNHDKTAAARYRARIMGARFVLEPTQLRMLLSQGSIVDGKVVVDLQRPDDPRLDCHVEFESADLDSLIFSLNNLRAGVWRVGARWRSRSQDVRLDTVIRVIR
ncbi:MAG: hypothetical protein FGM33_00240 [Candidatus Kapabacteria bacterium]|nr:hypothetical protein [Candidatus Kapabacteria bacterium]